MRLHVLLVGVPGIAALSVVAGLDDTVATVLNRITETLQQTGLPHEFTAYSAKLNDQWTLRRGAPDRIALREGDTTVMARYLTPHAQLDPTKTVVDNFGDNELPGNRIAIILHWTPLSWEQYAITMQRRMVERAEHTVKKRQRKDIDWMEKQKEAQRVQELVLLSQRTISGSSLRLTVVVTGVPDLVVSVLVNADDTIATVRKLVIAETCTALRQRIPHLVGAFAFVLYSAHHNGTWPLRRGAADCIALGRNDPLVMLRYLTPATKLSLKTSVGDCVADGIAMDADAIAMVLWWAPASLKQYHSLRTQLERSEHHDDSATQRLKTVNPQTRHGMETEESSVLTWLSGLLKWK